MVNWASGQLPIRGSGGYGSVMGSDLERGLLLLALGTSAAVDFLLDGECQQCHSPSSLTVWA